MHGYRLHYGKHTQNTNIQVNAEKWEHSCDWSEEHVMRLSKMHDYLVSETMCDAGRVF
jgi:hypothetical protein